MQFLHLRVITGVAKGGRKRSNAPCWLQSKKGKGKEGRGLVYATAHNLYTPNNDFYCAKNAILIRKMFKNFCIPWEAEHTLPHSVASLHRFLALPPLDKSWLRHCKSLIYHCTDQTAASIIRRDDKHRILRNCLTLWRVDLKNADVCCLSCIHTERQKKLITSLGRRPLKSTLSKLIIFGHK